jgi:hypothetical protein
MKCNVCGKEFENVRRNSEFYNPMLHRFTVNFGYGSQYDMDTWEFYKCENCLVEEIENFSILPKIESYDIL